MANIAFSAMTQLDMVLVKHLFPADQASIYYAASILGKAILYLPGGIVLALFPLVASNDAKGQASGHMLIQAAGFSGLICFLVASIYWFFGDWIILQFYGAKYEGAGDLLRLYGFAMLPMALVMVAEYFLIAKGRVLFAWLFLAIAPLQILAIYTWHEQLWMIVAAIAAFGSVLAVMGYLFLWREFRNE
jgi:O-antigen/teichoic acid export membrane protein